MFDWISSDWHIGETRMEIMQRPHAGPKDMFDDLLAKHNKVVSKTDKFLLVGDAVSTAATDPEKWLSKIKLFNGVKTLIRGNHDRMFSIEKLLEVFDKVIPEGDGLEFNATDELKCYATHYPSRGRHDKFNIVGHIHAAWKYQLNMLNACCDVHNYEPFHTSKIPFFLKAIEEFYDDDVWVAYNPINSLYNGSRGRKGNYFDRFNEER